MKLSTIFMFSTLVLGYIEAGDVATNSNKTLNGKALFDLGNRYNKPMLRLIGKTLMNLECQRSPCSEWSAWSSCKLFVGQFGAKSRTRTCGGTATNGCQVKDEQPTTESESVICQEFCPSNYEMVHGKFCLRYHNVNSQNKKNAESSCGSDGGFLININSPEKWSAFALLMEKYQTASYAHIDGQRKDNNSPWTYSYELYKTGYTNWGPGDPDNASSDLCMIVHKDTQDGWGMYDNDCTVKRHFVCEIIPE